MWKRKGSDSAGTKSAPVHKAIFISKRIRACDVVPMMLYHLLCKGNAEHWQWHGKLTVTGGTWWVWLRMIACSMFMEMVHTHSYSHPAKNTQYHCGCGWRWREALRMVCSLGSRFWVTVTVTMAAVVVVVARHTENDGVVCRKMKCFKVRGGACRTVSVCTATATAVAVGSNSRKTNRTLNGNGIVQHNVTRCLLCTARWLGYLARNWAAGRDECGILTLGFSVLWAPHTKNSCWHRFSPFRGANDAAGSASLNHLLYLDLRPPPYNRIIQCVHGHGHFVYYNNQHIYTAQLSSLGCRMV